MKKLQTVIPAHPFSSDEMSMNAVEMKLTATVFEIDLGSFQKLGVYLEQKVAQKRSTRNHFSEKSSNAVETKLKTVCNFNCRSIPA